MICTPLSWRIVGLVVPAALLLAFSSLAQLPDPVEAEGAARQGEVFEGQVEVAEVLLDVLVTDAQGAVVVGLGAEDFHVWSDGVELPVTGASFYSSRSFLGGLGGAGDEPAVKDQTAGEQQVERHFVLLFHRPPLASDGNPALRQRLPESARRTRQWMQEDLLPSDRVAVLAWDGELVLLQDFTTHRPALESAVQIACSGTLADRAWPSRSSAPEGPSPLARRSWHGAGETRERGAAVDVEPSVLDDLPALAELLGDLPGRKNLVLLGSDLPRPGRLPEAIDPYRRAEEALNEANVAVYSLDLLGRGRSAGADQLALGTGGESFFRIRSALDPLRTIARQTSGYYLLSVRVAADAGYHPLEVRLDDPALSARARAGYRAGS
ncbi:MAG: VWA domain-containing protein [Acidobacteriota bacterium]|nr:VWA domain-containing protein [Acidobacteriota bacterium]